MNSAPAHPESLTRYVYVEDNPATLADPSGRDPLEDPFCGLGFGDVDGGGGCGGGLNTQGCYICHNLCLLGSNRTYLSCLAANGHTYENCVNTWIAQNCHMPPGRARPECAKGCLNGICKAKYYLGVAKCFTAVNPRDTACDLNLYTCLLTGYFPGCG